MLKMKVRNYETRSRVDIHGTVMRDAPSLRAFFESLAKELGLADDDDDDGASEPVPIADPAVTREAAPAAGQAVPSGVVPATVTAQVVPTPEPLQPTPIEPGEGQLSRGVAQGT